jgi:hypothetical protein
MRSRNLLIGVGMLLMAGAARAQAPAPAPAMDGHTRFGIGVTLAPAALVLSGGTQSSYLPIGLGNVYFPILIGRGLKLEAEVGVLHASSEISGSGFSSSAKGTSLRLGMGAFKVMPLDGGATLVYVGPRVGIISTSTTTTYTTSPESTTKETDWVFGLAVGGEHFLGRHFSLGGELQANYVSFGQPTHEPSSGPGPTTSQSLISSAGLLFVRAYF